MSPFARGIQLGWIAVWLLAIGGTVSAAEPAPPVHRLPAPITRQPIVRPATPPQLFSTESAKAATYVAGQTRYKPEFSISGDRSNVVR